MNAKSFIWLSVAVFGTIGGYIPVLFGGSELSFTSIFGTIIGGLFGIWFGFKVSQYM